jgi:hypothetical protein
MVVLDLARLTVKPTVRDRGAGHVGHVVAIAARDIEVIELPRQRTNFVDGTGQHPFVRRPKIRVNVLPEPHPAALKEGDVVGRTVSETRSTSQRENLL